jgi:hypothetical protein
MYEGEDMLDKQVQWSMHYTPYSYTVLTYCTHTLYSYTVLIHCTHSLYSHTAGSEEGAPQGHADRIPYRVDPVRPVRQMEGGEQVRGDVLREKSVLLPQ